MNTLYELQQQVQQFILQGDYSGCGVQSADSLEIYRNAYFARALSAMQQDFPALHQFFGEAAFTQFSHDYLTAYPSKSPTLYNLGNRLIDFLRTISDCHPAVIELAKLEYTIAQIKIVANKPHMALQNLTPETQLQFHPSVCLIQTHWEIVEFWYAVKNDQDLPAIRQRDQAAETLLWRYEGCIHYLHLNEIQTQLANLFLQQKNLNEIAGGLVVRFPDLKVEQWLSETLQGWIQHKIFVDVSSD